MRNASIPSPSAGFTLVELMVVIVIGAILLSIAVPSYQAQIRKSRRTEARNAVLDLAAREERYFSVANTYTADPTQLGYAAGAFGAGAPAIGSGYYTLAVTPIAANYTATTQTPAGYTITATATGTQVNDTQCFSFTVNQAGVQSSLANDNATDTTSTCWK